MRLTCPNCAAQYEVDDDLIPSEGRDVQCSNCGTTWFEGGPEPEAGAPEVLPPPPPEPEPPTADDEDDAVDDEEDDEDYDEFDDDDEALDRAMTQAATPPRRLPPDQHVLDILRQEREHEDRVRASGPVPEDDAIPDEDDTPPEPPRSFIRRPSPPLDPREQAALERARMAEAATRARARDALRPVRPARGAEAPRVDRPTPAAPAPYVPREDAARTGPAGRSARRELLPDIEEINSSLRPTEPDDTYDDDPFARYDARNRPSRRRGGFRLGFVLASVIVLACLGVYAFADEIAAAVPELGSPLADYVAWVDRLRLAITTGAEGLTNRILPER